MKKVILPALLVGGLTLFSFTKSTNGGVNATGKNLEQQSTGLKFAQQNDKHIKGLMAKNYDLSKTQLIESSTKNGVKDDLLRSWLFKSKFSLSIFDANFIVWDTGTTTTKDVAKVTEVLSKYTNSASAKKVGENLYNITTATKFSEEDKKYLMDLIKKQYNLTDEQVKKGVELE